MIKVAKSYGPFHIYRFKGRSDKWHEKYKRKQESASMKNAGWVTMSYVGTRPIRGADIPNEKVKGTYKVPLAMR